MTEKNSDRKPAFGPSIATVDDTLSAPYMVQESPSTCAVIARLRKWAQGDPVDDCVFEHCIIFGPPGSGCTHLLDALAGTLAGDKIIQCTPTEIDWRKTLDVVDTTEEKILLIDNYDRYDNQFRKELLPKVAERRHRIAAVVQTPFVGRLERVWRANLSDPCIVHLDLLANRIEDLTAFIPHWVRQHGVVIPEFAKFGGTVRLLIEMELQGGFADVTRLLEEFAARGEAFWDPPDAKLWFGAYRRTILGKGSAKPVILVEGHTDAIYFEWVFQWTAESESHDVDIEPCNSAKEIPQQSFVYRNENRNAVALFDNDRVGRAHHENLREYGIRSLVIPERYNQLADLSRDYVLLAVEIEDLLPVDVIERFCLEKKREPELVISAPRTGKKRIVIHSDDKLELAKWVQDNIGVEDAKSFLELLNELRSSLGLLPIAFSSNN